MPNQITPSDFLPFLPRLKKWLPEGFYLLADGRRFGTRGPLDVLTVFTDDAALNLLCYAADQDLEQLGYVVTPEQKGAPGPGYVLREFGRCCVIGPAFGTKHEARLAALRATEKGGEG